MRRPPTRPPQLSPARLGVGLVVPLVIYLAARAAIGSATGALAITEAVSAGWLLILAVARRRVDPVAVVSVLTVAIALAAYALSGGDVLALKLRRGAVTGTAGVAALASVGLGRPLLEVVVARMARLTPERRSEIESRLADPWRRRALRTLTTCIGLTLAIDGASQVVLALTVPTGRFVADSTAARILVFGSGAALTFAYVRHYTGHRRSR